MSYMADIGSYLAAGSVNQTPKGLKVETQEDKMGLDMTDFLTLMVTELQNQSIDQTADTSDMLNQLVQMQMVQALVNMTDASVMSYAASLVGKEVTVTGTYDGNQVVFVGDKYYLLSEILAVGTLPKPETDPGEGETEGDGSQDGGETGTDAAPEV